MTREEFRDYVDFLRSQDEISYDVYSELIDGIDTLEQEPKTGYWISHYDEDAKEGWYECDRCHTERAFNTDFCPDCGCRMIEPQESEGMNDTN